jgi:uncharacterized PurR-regulated membrane protein YhhQ (DUF165 family)
LKNNFKRFDRSSKPIGSINDKLFNLTAIFLVVPFLSYLLIGAPISILQNFTSFGVLLLSIGIVLINLLMEIFGNRVAKKALLASLYGLIFIFIIQYLLLSTINTAMILTMLVFFITYLITYWLNIAAYKFLSYKLRKWFSIRFVLSFVISQIVLLGLFYIINAYILVNSFLLASFSFEVIIRLVLLFVGFVVVFILSKLLKNQNYQYNNSNNNSNRFSKPVEKNEKYNATNAKSTRSPKKDGSFKRRNEETRV